MKSSLKLRQERQAQRERDTMIALQNGSKPHKNKAPVVPENIGRELAHQYRQEVINGPDTFNRSLKTRDDDAIRLAYALHMFARYPVPKRVQAVWILRQEPTGRNLRRQPLGPLNPAMHRAEQLACFFAVGSGRSPFKDVYREVLTKKEVHRFLNCRFDLDYTRAIWWSIARTFTENDGLALRIAQSKLGGRDYHCAFYRDVARFFAANPLPKSQIDDLMDYIVESRDRNAEYSLKGRSLESLTVQMKVWHRELSLVKRIGHHKWDGLAIADWYYKHPAENGDEWSITQILNGKELAREGADMHHCVYSYRYTCSTGRIAIFSMKVKRAGGKELKRAVTIELTENADIVQVRGYANRLATSEENDILKRWAGENMLRIKGHRW